MNVANGDGERVGRVGRLGQHVQTEKPGDHELNLFLLGQTIAYDTGFDAKRCVFGNRDACRSRGEKGDAAYLAKF